MANGSNTLRVVSGRPFVQSQQRAAAWYPPPCQLRAGRFGFHQQRYVLQSLAESRRDARVRRAPPVGRTRSEPSDCYSIALADHQPKRVVVAIDGPAGAGKSTIATPSRRPPRLHLHRYRRHVPRRRPVGAAPGRRLRRHAPHGATGHRRRNRTRARPHHAQRRRRHRGHPHARSHQRRLAKSPSSRASAAPWWPSSAPSGERASVVMEGRDIGTVVFPDADVKIYLDADRRRARPAPPRGTARQRRTGRRRRTLPRRSRSATGATAPAPMRPSPRRPTPSISIPPRSPSTRWKRPSSRSSARASPTERIHRS